MKNDPDRQLIFLHFSDIHFHKKNSVGIYDLDQDIRNEIEIDIEMLTQDIESVNGIIISGDIAFAGVKEEYKISKIG